MTLRCRVEPPGAVIRGPLRFRFTPRFTPSSQPIPPNRLLATGDTLTVTLTVRNVTRAHSGKYTCEAGGVAKQDSLTMVVQTEPQVVQSPAAQKERWNIPLWLIIIACVVGLALFACMMAMLLLLAKKRRGPRNAGKILDKLTSYMVLSKRKKSKKWTC